MDLIDNRELHDTRKIIVITKSEGSISKKFIYKIGKLNCRLIVVKTSKIVKSDSNIVIEIFNLISKRSSGYIIFLSSNAVDIFFEIVTSLNVVNKIVDDLNSKFSVIAIGPSTQSALIKNNIVGSKVPQDHSSLGIIELLSQLKNDMDESKIIVPRSKKADKFLKEQLLELGFEIDEFYIYNVIPAEVNSLWLEFFNLLRKNKIDSLIFTSPSNVNYFLNIIQNHSSDLLPLVSKIKLILSIGPLTSNALFKYNIPFSESKNHSLEGIYETIYMKL
ncbi:MAG TPA: uroporphyrinogen-III synthase [Nitrososphaeraceae archaeon]|nr:uroporphyrinogen-III synthase [Nitrososphaeraceae archaeon]